MVSFRASVYSLIQVRMKNSEDWPKAEVISIRQVHSIFFLFPSRIQTSLLAPGESCDAVLCALC